MHGHLLYSVAKAGLAALTRGLAQELAPQVRVNAVAPGVILWPEGEDWQDESQRRKIVAHTLLKRDNGADSRLPDTRRTLHHRPGHLGRWWQKYNT